MPSILFPPSYALPRSLSGNSFSGSIPDSLGAMTELTVLLLGENRFRTPSGVTSSLQNLTKLQILNVSYSGLSGHFLSWLGSYTELEVFSAVSTNLALVLDPSIGQFVLPENINLCTKLRVLEYGVTNMAYFPATLAQVTTLEVLDLYSSATGVFGWPEFGTATALKVLRLKMVIQPQDNVGYGFPSWLFSALSLETLHITGNLNTTIPAAIGQLTALKSLQFQSTALHGTLPPQIGNLVNLEDLMVVNNYDIEGPLPDSMGQMVKLKYLMLRGNLITALPSTLGQMVSLIVIDLQGNQLSGALPPNVQGLTKLRNVYISGNNLSGAFHSSYAQLTGMTLFFARDNQLTTLPDMSRWTNLTNIDVSFNPISNGFPSSILNIRSLRSLSMTNCGLTGTIPDRLFENMTSLTSVSLDRNQISGPLPKSLLNISTLQTLYLNDNMMEGRIADYNFTQLPVLGTLTLSNNRFYGPIPEWIFKLGGNNKIVNLSYNRLNGTIPDHFLADLSPNVRLNLNLAYNNLEGQLPSSLNGTLGAKFTVINLNGNHLKICANPNITVLDPLMSCQFRYQQVSNYYDCGCESVFNKCATTPDPIGECIPCLTPAPSFETTGVDWMCYNGYWYYNGTEVETTHFSSLDVARTPVVVHGNLTIGNLTFLSLSGFLNVSHCFKADRLSIQLNAADSAILASRSGIPPHPLLNIQYDDDFSGGGKGSKTCASSTVTIGVTQNKGACTLRSNSTHVDPRTLASSFSIANNTSCGRPGLQWWGILLIAIACVLLIAIVIGIVFTVHPKLRSIVRPYHNRARPKMSGFDH